jgi:hypothetical protein
LIEVMIAVTIFGMVLAAIYSSWALILRASRVSQTAAAQVQRERLAVHTLEDALTCIQSFQASLKYYSFVVSEEPPELDFTARLPDGYLRGKKFGGLSVRQLQFALQAGPEGEKDLVLRQRPILLDLDEDEQQRPLVLARYVQTFKVECWDTNAADWVTVWDNTNAIPPLIRVSLVLGGNRTGFGNTAPTLAVSRVIAVPSQMMPTAAQAPTGVGSTLNPGLVNPNPSSPNPNPNPANPNQTPPPGVNNLLRGR